mmetsp:Transcript_7983/g.20854  ORF Transcript_7983/g.20854 Transcript_7983/m.20854 type:complete len:82 (+) Transcript_7983:422-667(+)
MEEVVNNQQNHTVAERDSVNFQAVSCTLEAGVKIYASRVDSVHSETFKILSGLSRTEMKRQENDGGKESLRHFRCSPPKFR